MAEHRNVDPGPGPAFAPVAVDVDGSGDEWQRIKVGYGPDGTPADVTTANPLPVVQTGTPALPTGAATAALQSAEATLVGAVTESAPGTDTASSGLNGRLQRIAQRLTSLLAVLPSALGQTTKAGSLSVTLASNQDALPITDNAGSLTVDGTVTANVGTTNGLALDASVTAHNALLGAVTEIAPATDTASSGLNGRLQRIAQRLTTLLAGGLPAALGANGGLKIEGVASGTVVPVGDGGGSLTVDGSVTADTELTTADLDTGGGTDTRAVVGIALAASGGATIISAANPLPVTGGTSSTQFAEDAAHASGDVGTMALGVRKDTAAALAGTDGDYMPSIYDASGRMHVNVGASALPTGAALDATIGTTNTEIGGLTETAPGTDTASSGLNGRLQRIAQRLTSLIALLPASLGQKTMANGLAVTIASDQTVIPVSDNAGSLTVDNGGTFAVQDSQKIADNAAFTDGTTPVQPSGFVFDEVAGTALTENDIAAGRVDSKRAQVGVVEDATTRGQRLAVSAAGAAKVDGSAVTQPVSAAALPLPSGAATEATLAAQTKVDNAAFTDGTTPVSPVGYIFDEVAGTALTENDVAAARINANRAQVSVIEDETTRGRRTTVTAANALKVDGSAVTQPVSGTVAVSGTMPVSVAAGQEVDGHSANIGALADASSASTLTGLLKNIKAALAGALTTELSTGATPYSNTALSNTKQQVKASAGKIHGWMVHNPSAATAYIQVWDVASGSITVGTTAPTWTIQLPAGASANVAFEKGIAHATAINIAATTTPTGSTAPASALVVSIFYV